MGCSCSDLEAICKLTVWSQILGFMCCRRVKVTSCCVSGTHFRHLKCCLEPPGDVTHNFKLHSNTSDFYGLLYPCGIIETMSFETWQKLYVPCAIASCQESLLNFRLPQPSALCSLYVSSTKLHKALAVCFIRTFMQIPPTVCINVRRLYACIFMFTRSLQLFLAITASDCVCP